MTDLFDPVVSQTQLSERFKTVAQSAGYAPARGTMRDVFSRMGERDANFIEQFQTSGFDARVSELYLFAALEAAGFDVSSAGDAPDFLVRGPRLRVGGGGPPPRTRHAADCPLRFQGRR